MNLSDIISAIGLLLNVITGKKNSPKIVIKVRPINVVDQNTWELDVTRTLETGNIEKVFVPKRIDIEITVINEGPGSAYIEQVDFIMQSPGLFEPNNSFSYPPSSFGSYDNPVEVKERTNIVFRIDREVLKKEALGSDLGEVIEQIWIKDATHNYAKLRIPTGMKHIFDFRQ